MAADKQPELLAKKQETYKELPGVNLDLGDKSTYEDAKFEKY